MPKIFSKTQSVCPVCLKVIEASRAVGGDGNIYFLKTCPDHGDFSTLIWEGGIVEYLMWDTSAPKRDGPAAALPAERGCPYDCGLCEAHESSGCCVLLELTNRCNLRCPVCFASAGEGEARDLPLEEISAQYDMLMARGGPFNIQLSGGEPTMRDDLPEIIDLGLRKGFHFFQLNTNGLRLAEEPGYAEKLKAAGLSCVFLQFDGMDDKVYTALRGRPLMDVKLKAIDRCAAAGLGVVLVPVIAPEVNEDQVGSIIRFGLKNMPHVRGVHFQPVSYFGRCGLTAPAMRITIPRMLRLIEAQTGGQMKAGDFGGGGAENPYCSFHASYMRRDDGGFMALPRPRSECCCTTSAEARDFVARQWSGREENAGLQECGMTETSSLDEFLEKARENTFAVSGMLFQDAWNLDLERLRRCYICEVDSERGMVPFCAYNLTDAGGRPLYRK
ncbi:MAG TPA: radical SAM protein [Clostridiales bacterium]|nr:radical SAM protein [Clostridiales bacterium]